MATSANHWKVGAFVVGGALLGLFVAIYLGAAKLRSAHIDYVTYFDESVQGLEVGSPVKFRGVTVGRVAEIDVAPDRRHVAVTAALSSESLSGLGLSEGKGIEQRVVVPADLRMQLVSQGITGLKFLQLDFFDVQQFPVQALAFAPAVNHIPAARSTLKHLEDATVSSADRMPEILDNLTKISAQTALTLAHMDALLTNLNDAVVGLDVRRLSGDARETMAHLNVALDRASTLLGRLDGDKGLLASAQRAADGFGDLAAMSPQLGDDVSDTLRDIRAAAASLRRFTDALERDPDMLLKGRRVSQ